MPTDERAPLTNEAVARWIETTPPPPWWAASDGEWGLFCVLTAPDPSDPSAGSVPEGVASPPEWDPYDVDDEADDKADDEAWWWKERPDSPGKAPGVDWPDLVRLAWYARTRLPGLVAEVRRLRNALADLGAEVGVMSLGEADPTPVRAAYDEGHDDGVNDMAAMARRALKGEEADD